MTMIASSHQNWFVNCLSNKWHFKFCLSFRLATSWSMISYGLTSGYFFNPHLRTFFFSLLLAGKAGRERNISVRKDLLVSSHKHPDKGSNPKHFGYGMMLQPTEPRRPGQPLTAFTEHLFLNIFYDTRICNQTGICIESLY